MIKSIIGTLMLSAALGFAAVGNAVAQNADSVIYSTPTITVVGGVGYTWLEGNELVYDGAGNRISHLIWESSSPVLSLGATGHFGDAWTLSGNVQVGFSGNSHMVDYDWLGFSPSFAQADWDHRSIHPDTRLDRYVNFDITAGRDFEFGQAVVNLHGGFKYTNVKWTAYGGSYIYSTGGFRDTVGNFADGVRGITFEQRMPGLFLGAAAKSQFDRFTLSGTVRGGLTIGATDTDHHWIRDRRFEETYGAIPFVSVGAEVGYQVSRSANIFLAANYEQFFRTTGNTTTYEIPSGTQVSPTIVNAAGMSFRAIALKGGLKVAF